jgi:hypothetical protein
MPPSDGAGIRQLKTSRPGRSGKKPTKQHAPLDLRRSAADALRCYSCASRRRTAGICTTRVTRGLRLPLRSMVMSPAFSSARRARRFASGSTSHSRMVRLETIKLSEHLNPRRNQRLRPTHKAPTPSWRAWDNQTTFTGPLMNLPEIGVIRQPFRMPDLGDVTSLRSIWKLFGSQLPLLL